MWETRAELPGSAARSGHLRRERLGGFSGADKRVKIKVSMLTMKAVISCFHIDYLPSWLGTAPGARTQAREGTCLDLALW